MPWDVIYNGFRGLFGGGGGGNPLTGLFSIIVKAIKSALNVVFKPLYLFLISLMATLAAAIFDLLKPIFLWLINLLSKVFSEIVSALGFEGLDAAGLWADLNNHEWGAKVIYAMTDLGVVEGLAIILVALVIKFILMIIPFIG